MRRYLLVSILIGLMSFGVVGCSGLASTGTAKTPTQAATSNPTPTATVAPEPTLAASSVRSIPTVMSFYQAIKQEDYAKAYTYVDSNATTTSGQKLTQATLAQLAHAEDVNYGVINNVNMSPESTDGTQVLLTIDRTTGMHYHTHLVLKQEGNTWRIISVDRI
jgi:hypothetical protein